MAVGRRVVKTTTTVKTDIIREHRCLGCGHVFSYPLTVAGSHTSKFGPNQLAAAKNLSDNVKTCVGQVPCPNCKMLQPEMVQQLRSDGLEDGVGALIMGLLMFALPMALFGVWHRVLGVLLIIFTIWSWENLKQMNLNPNRKVSRKCRLRERPGGEGFTPLKKWATGLTILAAVAGSALFVVGWVYPDKTVTENLEIRPAWVYPGDEVEVALRNIRQFEAFRQVYSQEVDCRYQVGGESIPLEVIGGRWKFNRTGSGWKSSSLRAEKDWRPWIGHQLPEGAEDTGQMLASLILKIPEDCPADPLGKLSVSWVLSYPWVSTNGGEVHKKEQMVTESIDMPLRPVSTAFWRSLCVVLKRILGLVGVLSLILGNLLIPAAGKIKGFPSSILLPGNEGYGSGEPAPVEELLHT